jgi:DNA-binding NarL/FixJ family response regulator
MSVSKVLLVDDHPLLREGLASLINRLSDLQVCGEAETAADALRLVDETSPDVAIVDLSLREGSGLDVIKQIRAKAPGTAVVVLSMHDEQRFAERAIRAGARGYVMKGEATSSVVAAVRDVLKGNLVLSPQMRSTFIERFVDGVPPASLSPVDVLTDRELEVYQLLGQGYETRKIASVLNISIKTVQTFCERIKHKLQLANASELLREAVRWAEDSALGRPGQDAPRAG